MRRGEVWWASMPDPVGSGPGYRRPYLIVSADSFNQSRINTVTLNHTPANLRLADAPGNVRLPSRGTGLSKPSVANVSQVITIDKSFLTERVGRVPSASMSDVDEGLRLALALLRRGLTSQRRRGAGRGRGDGL